MKEFVGTNAVREFKRDGNILQAKTVFKDDKALGINEDIRLSGMLDNKKFGLHDDEDVRLVISCPDGLQWLIFKKKHYETYKKLMSFDEPLRMEGARELQILHPAWVVMSRL
jgi:hypothetical protein